MGEDGFRADQTGYICGNPADDPLPDIRGMADSVVPQAKSTVAIQRKRSNNSREIPHFAQNGRAVFERELPAIANDQGTPIRSHLILHALLEC